MKYRITTLILFNFIVSSKLNCQSTELRKSLIINFGLSPNITYINSNYDIQVSSLYSYTPLNFEVEYIKSNKISLVFNFEIAKKDLSQQNNYDSILILKKNLGIGLIYRFNEDDLGLGLRYNLGICAFQHFRNVKNSSPFYGTIPDLSQTKLKGFSNKIGYVFNTGFNNSKRFLGKGEIGLCHQYYWVTERILDKIKYESNQLKTNSFSIYFSFGLGLKVLRH